MKPRLAIVGLGLIGGSLARALRAAGAVAEIAAFDEDPEQLAQGLRLGVVDRIAPTAAEAVTGADWVVIAVPVLRTAEAFAAIQPGLGATTVVSDVGSTKRSVLADVARAAGGAPPPWFVAAHPIAGTEKSGVAHAFSGLFTNRRVVITPHAAQSPEALSSVREMWTAAGARVVEMDADTHDAIFAATSHLPHLLAYSYVERLASRADAEAIFPNAGGGFRDFTRIASSSPRMWHDIVRANRDAVLAQLEAQIAGLEHLRDCLRDERWSELLAVFECARSARERHLAHIE